MHQTGTAKDILNIFLFLISCLASVMSGNYVDLKRSNLPDELKDKGDNK